MSCMTWHGAARTLAVVATIACAREEPQWVCPYEVRSELAPADRGPVGFSANDVIEAASYSMDSVSATVGYGLHGLDGLPVLLTASFVQTDAASVVHMLAQNVDPALPADPTRICPTGPALLIPVDATLSGTIDGRPVSKVDAGLAMIATAAEIGAVSSAVGWEPESATEIDPELAALVIAETGGSAVEYVDPGCVGEFDMGPSLWSPYAGSWVATNGVLNAHCEHAWWTAMTWETGQQPAASSSSQD